MSKGTQPVLKAAKARFIPTISKYGFSRYRTSNTFVKRLGDIYHFISFNGSQWGGGFFVDVTAWVPEITGIKESARETFEYGKNVVAIGGRLSPRCVGEGTWFWEYGDEDELLKTLDELSELFETVALPWFACMSTREQLARGLGPSEDDTERRAVVEGGSANPDFGIEDTAVTAPYPWAPGALRSINANSWWSEGDDEAFLRSGGKLLQNHMEALGFKLQRAPVFRFIKEVNGYFRVITLESASDGVHLSVGVCTFSRDAAHALYETCNQEILDSHFWQVNGGFLGTEGIRKGRLAWLVAGEAALEATIPELISAIEKWALPWFERVGSHQGFLESLQSHQLPGERYAALVKRVEARIHAQRRDS